MLNQLIVLQVVIPLIAAPLCIILSNAKLVRAFVIFVCTASFSISAYLLYFVSTSTTKTISYALGGWAAPFGIEYRMDIMSALIGLIVSFIALIVILYGKRSILQEIPEKKITLFYTAFLLCLTGLLGITATGDAFNVFVFLEISSLASYALISLGKSRACLLAAFRYLIMGTVGATFILIGIGLLYAHTGTLNIYDLGEKVAKLHDIRTIYVAYAFIVIGLAIKVALFPFHLWLPKAYSESPTVVSAFLAGTATKVAIYALIRFTTAIFGIKFSFTTLQLDVILLVLSIITILYGSLVAIFQTDIKRLMAYSSIAQIGYMTLGLSLISVLGLQASLAHIFNHAIIKTSLFLLIGCLVLRMSSSKLSDLQGLGKAMPFTSAGIVIGGFSLIGIPLTAGFVSKWYLVLAALEQNQWWIVAVILFASLLAVVYVWKIIEVLYFKPAKETNVAVKEAPLSMLIPVMFLVFLNIYFGIETSLNAGITKAAAMQIIGS